MVRKAAALGYRHIIRDTEIEDELAEEIGYQPVPEAFDSDDEFYEAIREYTDALTETERYREWYAETIDPTLEISRHVGNWYTGSVHIARAAGLKHARESGRDLDGKELLVASYGSGAQAEVHAETLVDGWEEEIAQLNVDEQIRTRYELSFEEYEQIHDVHNHDLEADANAFTDPSEEFVFDGWGRMGERTYKYVE